MSIFRQILRTQNVKQVNQALFNGTFSYRFCSAAAFDTKKLDEITKKSKVVIFMKGNPEQPMCGFSNAVVQILRMHGVQYDSYNVLENDSLRQGEFSEVNKPFMFT